MGAPRSFHTAMIAVATGAITLGLASCSIREDAAPRQIPEEQSADFGATPSGQDAIGDRTIYLLTPVGADEQPQLRSVRRNTSANPSDLIDSLLDGPNLEENRAGLTSALPDDLTLLGATTVGTRLTIDLSEAITLLSDLGQRDALAQIVATATGIDQIKQVRILVAGETTSWPIGDGEVTDRPLTIYDYPGFVESSQPSFAALPP
jgi:spore germination protein GerM